VLISVKEARQRMLELPGNAGGKINFEKGTLERRENKSCHSQKKVRYLYAGGGRGQQNEQGIPHQDGDEDGLSFNGYVGKVIANKHGALGKFPKTPGFRSIMSPEPNSETSFPVLASRAMIWPALVPARIRRGLSLSPFQ